jgi:hypothetical protein
MGLHGFPEIMPGNAAAGRCQLMKGLLVNKTSANR